MTPKISGTHICLVVNVPVEIYLGRIYGISQYFYLDRILYLYVTPEELHAYPAQTSVPFIWAGYLNVWYSDRIHYLHV